MSIFSRRRQILRDRMRRSRPAPAPACEPPRPVVPQVVIRCARCRTLRVPRPGLAICGGCAAELVELLGEYTPAGPVLG